MDAKSQEKVTNAGFTIIRKDDHPQPRIKYKDKDTKNWKTYSGYTSKAARDRTFNMLITEAYMIED